MAQEDFINSETFKIYQGTLGVESDRGCVLITVAILDDLFYAFALEKFAHGTTSVLGHLFEPPLGYLSGFMAKTDLLFALGVLTKDMHRDIVKINQLRNSCAHSVEPFQFTKEIYDSYISGTAGANLHEHLEKNDWIYSPAHINAKKTNLWRIKCEGALVLNLTLLNVFLSHIRQTPHTAKSGSGDGGG